jgi:hypothetical protein
MYARIHENSEQKFRIAVIGGGFFRRIPHKARPPVHKRKQ